MIGQKLLHYEIVEKLGEGGMGVVYKARDAHLDRFVAVKVLPPEKVADAGRKARFVQEAKAASALNHPNIVTVHDISSDGGVDFIAMEFVAGKTLDQIIPRKGMRLNDALKIAVQIAGALTRAHAAGIVHRDLKPANAMVDEHGLVKVLDFGLAKLTETALGEADATRTVKPRTEEGTIVGTAAYMSPEQAEGKPVDARSDIFSFGAVLYEMVTGARAFRGDSRMSTLAAVLHHEPAPPSAEIPHDLQKVIARCLRKDPARRFQHMDDVKIALEELREESDSGSLAGALPAPPKRKARRRAAWVSAVVLAGLAGAAIWYLAAGRTAPEQAPKIVQVTTDLGIEHGASFSPDGTQIAYSWDGEKRDNVDIYVRVIGSGTPHRLTTAPEQDFGAAWSPDGRSIAFLHSLPGGRASLMVVPPLGGSARAVCEVSGVDSLSSRPAWTSDSKYLVVGDSDAPERPLALTLVAVESGEKKRLTSPPAESAGDDEPAFSPDGLSLAFTRARGDRGIREVYLLPVSANVEPRGEARRLTQSPPGANSPVFTPDGREVVFVRSDGFFASRLWRVKVSGGSAPRPVESLASGLFHPAFSRRDGKLAMTHVLLDLNIWQMEFPGRAGGTGEARMIVASTRQDTDPQLSLDGKRIAFQSDRTGTTEIWICNADGSEPVQLTFSGAGSAGSPRWSPDGEQIAFDSNVTGIWNIYVVRAAGGRPRRLTSGSAQNSVPSWSRDGRWVYFNSNRGERFEIFKVPAGGGDPVQVTRAGGFTAFESADRKWLYYTKGAEVRSTGLWRMPLDGGTETLAVESVLARTFVVADSGVYFISVPPGSFGCVLNYWDGAIGVTRQIAALAKPPFPGLSVSADGRRVLYSQMDRFESDLILVENFR